MLTTLARFATTRPRVVLAAALLVMLACGAFGASAASHMKAGGFVTGELESVRSGEFLSEHFPGGATNYILLVTAPEGADSPAARAAGEKAVAQLTQFDEVSGVQSYWTTRADLAPALRSKDGKSALVIAYVAGDDSELTERADRISQQVQTSENGVTVRAGGLGAAFADMNTQISKDLIVAEAIAIPLTGLLLVLVFGSVVAAAMPVAIGLFAVVAALGILRTLTVVTDVSIYALNMTTALGLALAIDYSLFIVSRYREELARGLDPAAAVVRSVQTAGRTVVYSALVVALSLAALAVFPQYFFKSFAYAGVAVVCAAAAAAVIVLPAMLVLLGDRVNAWDLRAGVRRLLGRPEPVPVPADRSFWYRWVIAVMRRAIPVALLTTVLLLLVGSPFLGAQFGYPDDRALSDAPSREVGDELRANFQADMATSILIALPEFEGGVSEIGDYAAALSKVPDVPAVLSGAGVYLDGLKVAPPLPGMISDAGAFVSVGTRIDPYSGAGKDQLAQLREVPAPGETLFGGPGALNQDSLTAIGERLPLAAVLIAVTTLVLLFLFTGSLLLPIKALALNMLSLAATFGAMVWVFQEGHLSGLLGFTPTGNLDLSMPILMFSIAFGASMDYEVFLLSRIREEWLAGPKTAEGNTHAVAMGVARTGRIFTAAALLMSIVFFAVATSGVTAMKLFGIGCALAVLSDATVIRGLLAPALMRLLGTANWWAPRPLAALHARFGLHEAEEHPAFEVEARKREAVSLGK
ncbi:MMPL family transporter [Nocardia shimofusensis]|uniref:MMPL family transporter n=1 Tax=Nocardia shimofusensis TaxID=228596 RepID=UPI000834636A|nr:MMPL family transporter [Nocardia shimofusensis]